MSFCTNCGQQNDDTARVCTNCGNALKTAPAAESWRQSGDLGSQQSQGASRTTADYTPPSAYSYAPPMSGALNQPFSVNITGQLNYAAWSDRVVAALLDAALVMGGVIVLYIGIIIISLILSSIGSGVSEIAGGDQGAAGGRVVGSVLGSGFRCIAFALMPLAALGIGLYNKVYLVNRRGSSIGQGMMKLKVVTAQGNLVPVGTLVLRLLVQVAFDFVPFLPILSILWPLWDPQRQALHDKAVNTFVIKTS